MVCAEAYDGDCQSYIERKYQDSTLSPPMTALAL